MITSGGWSSLSTNADTYSVNIPMPDTIGRPGGLMLSCLASIMKLSGLELKFKWIYKTSPCHDSVIIYQNQHVELTLHYVLFTTYIYIYLYSC